MFRVLSAALVMIALTSCSYVYDVIFDVRLDRVAASVPGSLVLQIVPQGGGLPDQQSVAHTVGRTRYTVTVSTCCAPNPVVSLHAFFDSNSNGVADASEPASTDARSALMLAGTTATSLRLTGLGSSGAP